MELKLFVKETLTQIIEGVTEAQTKAKESGAVINPMGYFTEGQHKVIKWLPERATGEEWREGQIVEFDVSVVVSEKDETQGGAGIQIASVVIGVGVSAKSADENSMVSRLKFSVPLFLPEAQ